MTRRRVWDAKYIGDCFTYNGEEVILEDVFYWEDEKGKTREQGINYITHQEMKQFSPICQG